MLSNNIHSLVAALAFLTISGCGQEKELVTASEVLDPPTIKFSAIDGLLHAEPGILREVDLRQYVVDGEGVEFTDVVSLNPHCAHPKLSDVGFDVYPEKGGCVTTVTRQHLVVKGCKPPLVFLALKPAPPYCLAFPIQYRLSSRSPTLACPHC